MGGVGGGGGSRSVPLAASCSFTHRAEHDVGRLSVDSSCNVSHYDWLTV